MKVKFNNLIPDKDLAMELTGAYMRVMTSGQYIGGKEVEAFEREWAEYCEAEYCVSCSSGQSALELLLKAHDIGYGDEVIVPAWTAIPTWKAIINVGATPRPVDVDYDTMLLNGKIKVRWKDDIVIAVHLYGYRCDFETTPFDNIRIINDACQAHGLKSLGDAAWSFYPTKNLGAYGDGGAITTDNEKIANLVRFYRDSSRLDPLQATFLRVKLKYLDKTNEVRFRNAQLYHQMLSTKIKVSMLDGFRKTGKDTFIVDWQTSVYHQYVIRVKERNKLKEYLAKRNIETMIHYLFPAHRQSFSIADGDYPNADRLSQEVLSLPIACSQEQVEYVCEAINEFYQGDQ